MNKKNAVKKSINTDLLNLSIEITTISKDDKECIAETGIKINAVDFAAVKKVLFKAARNINSRNAKIIENGLTYLFAMSVYDLDSDYTNDAIKENMMNALKHNVNFFNISLDHLIDVQFKDAEKLQYANAADIDATFKWYYQPKIDCSVDALIANKAIEDAQINVTDDYVEEGKINYIKSHASNQFLKDNDVIVDGAVIDTVWTMADQQKEEIRVVLDKKNIVDEALYDLMLGKSVNDVVEHSINEQGLNIGISIEIKKVQVFDIPEITDEVAKSIGFTSVADFTDKVKVNLQSFMNNINHEYKLGQLSEMLLDAEHGPVPSRYSDYLFDIYMKKLCHMFKLNVNDLNDDYGKLAFVNTFKKCFANVNAETFDAASENIKEIAHKAVSARFKLFSIMEKSGISKLHVQILASQNKLSVDRILLHLFFEHLQKDHADIFHKKEIIASYNLVETLKQRANNMFWFDNRRA